MKPKIEDVAKLAGVSPTTVSRVLNNRGYISEKTKTKVEAAMQELNYFPNDVARSLFNKRSHLIGLILPTTANPFFGELTFHIENYCAANGYKVLLCNSLNQVDKEERYLEMLLRNQVDGIIVGTHNRGLSITISKTWPSWRLTVTCLTRFRLSARIIIKGANWRPIIYGQKDVAGSR